jgi:hypothetical protein
VFTLASLLARLKSFLIGNMSPTESCSSELMLLAIAERDDKRPGIPRRRRSV